MRARSPQLDYKVREHTGEAGGFDRLHPCLRERLEIVPLDPTAPIDAKVRRGSFPKCGSFPTARCFGRSLLLVQSGERWEGALVGGGRRARLAQLPHATRRIRRSHEYRKSSQRHFWRKRYPEVTANFVEVFSKDFDCTCIAPAGCPTEVPGNSASQCARRRCWVRQPLARMC